MSELEPADSATEFVRLLRELGVDSVVIGALAALRYRGDPRLTTDVDLLVRDPSGVVEELRDRGFRVVAHAEPGQSPHSLYVRGHGHQVDILVVETEYQAEAWSRAVDGYLAVEDVLVHKLIAWRPRDRDDIASILDAGVPYDGAYVSRWADSWGVLDRWVMARRR
jgi:hypothetical protein